MNWVLKDYQQKAVDEIVTAVRSLLIHEGRGEICVFKAPTGSGKTLMMAKAIQEISRQLPEDDFCYLWVSIGKGDLHLQSKHSLESYFGGAPKVSLIEEEFGGSRTIIARNEVVVANWEKLRTRDRATGEWKNTLMREGEKVNFLEVLEATRKKRALILVIDESHVGAGAERTTELRDLIQADVAIEVSATPKTTVTASDTSRHQAEWVEVDPYDVIREGIIKKEIVINENLESLSRSAKDSQQLVLEVAWKKRQDLAKAYREVGSSVNPLVLIQIPASEAGEDVKQFALGFLKSKGVPVSKLAIWLSEQKTETIDDIADPENEVEFLIFKQAIDTGWDCPRAQILVKFRKPGNEVFEIQTVGRILRMPEQKHYENEILNKGYVFTNQLDFTIKHEEYNPNIIVDIPVHRIKAYKPIRLRSFYISRADYGDVASSFTPVFAATANRILKLAKSKRENIVAASRQMLMNLKTIQEELIADTTLKTKTFDELVGRIDPSATVQLEKSSNQVLAEFEEFIRHRLGSFTNVKRSVPAVKSSIYLWFKDAFGSADWKEELLMVQKIVTHPKNRAIFDRILTEAIAAYKHVRDAEVRERTAASERLDPYELPEPQYFNQYTVEPFMAKRYAYDKCLLDKERSDPERHFEEYIDQQSTVLWWWKNGEGSKEFFGVRYEYIDGVHTFYPDYIVQYKDGRIGIFETKDEHDREGSTYTKAKAEALQTYTTSLKRKDVSSGIVIQRGKTWYLNGQPKYRWDATLKGDWTGWHTIA
ncbi:MAG: DEAD/DEAH box helicase family protein [Patescibacteria group bacterium]